jgi:predicted peptidase
MRATPHVVAVLVALVAAMRPGAPPPTAGDPAAADTFAARFVLREVTVGGVVHRYAVWLPPGWSAARAWPGILFLHGSGECGTDGVAPTRIGIGPALTAHPERWPCVVVFPQKPVEDEEWEEREALVLTTLGDAVAAFHIDRARIALTGNSQGGHGTWMLGARHPSLWTCLVPVCGYGRPATIVRRVGTLPTWAFHGLADQIVDPHDTQAILESLRAERARRGDTTSDSRLTLLPGVGHNAWDFAYVDPALPAWILAQRRDD